MRLDNDRGGGALLSTAGDLIIWNDALANSRLGAFVTEKLHEPAKLNNGRKLRHTRGLFADTIRGSQFWWHGGSADGYKSVLGRFPEQGLSIAIMCNSGDGTDRTAFARRIFELYAPGAGAREAGNTAPPIAAEGVDVAGLDLNSRAGLFFSEGAGEPLRLVVDRGRLRAANGLSSNSTIKVGQRLQLRTPSKPSSASSGTKTASAGSAFPYTVRKGDTLARIAMAHGTSVDSICRWNGLSKNAILKVGTRLTLYR